MEENDRGEDIPAQQEVPPNYLAPVGPEDDEGFVGIDLEPVPGETAADEDEGRG